MRRLPALLLLAALVGGIGASSMHGAHHALEWADAQERHADDHGDGDHAGTPCSDGDAHALDCAVCLGVGGAVAETHEAVVFGIDVEDQRAASAAYVDYRRAVAPARGPPAVA